MALSDLVVALRLNAKGFEDGMRAASRSVATSMRGIEKDISGFKKLGSAMSSVGTQLSVLSAAVVAGMGAAGKAFITFDGAMNESLAIMGNVSDSMKNEMSSAAREMATSTTFSAEEAAKSYFFLASAGLDAKGSIEALPAVASFAQAGMFDMALATDLLTDAQSALGLTIRDDAVANMENMVRVSDVLVKANTLANASVQQFSEALTNKAGAALRIVGKDVEEGVAVLAAFADQGVKGAEAGTQFSIVLRDLQTKAIDNAGAFQAAGVAVFDAAGEMNNIGSIVGDLETALTGMSDEQKKATLLMLGFSDKSVAALQALIGTSDAIASYETALRSAGGITKEVSDKQLGSLESQLKILKSEFMDAAIGLGQTLAPAISAMIPVFKDLAEFIKGVAEQFAKLPTVMQATILGATALVLALGPVLLIAGQLTTAITTLLPVLAGMGPAFAAIGGVLTGPVGLIALIGVGLVGAYFALDKSFVKMKGTIGAQTRELAKLRKEYRDGKLTIEQYTKAVHDLDPKYEEMDRKQQDAADSAWDLHSKIAGLKKELESQGIEVDETGKSLDEYYDALVAAKNQNTQMPGALAPTTGALKDQAAAAETAEGWYTKYLAATVRPFVPPPIKDFTVDIEANTAALQTNMEAMVAAVGPIGQTETAFEELSGGILQSAEDLAKTTPKFEAAATKTATVWGTAMQQVSTSVTNAAQEITGILIGTRDGSIGDAFKKLGEAVLTSFVEPATKAITDFISGTIKDLIKSLIGGDGVGGALGKLKDAFGGIFGGGGAVSGGGGGSTGGSSGGGGGIGSVVGGVVDAFGVGFNSVIAAYGLKSQQRTEVYVEQTRDAVYYILFKVNEFLPVLKDINTTLLGWGGSDGIFGQINDAIRIDLSDRINELRQAVLAGFGGAVQATQGVTQAVAESAERTGRVFTSVFKERSGNPDTVSALIAAQVLDGYQTTDTRTAGGGFGRNMPTYSDDGIGDYFDAILTPERDKGTGRLPVGHDPAGARSVGRSTVRAADRDATAQEKAAESAEEAVDVQSSGFDSVVASTDGIGSAIVDARMAIVQAIGAHQVTMAEWFGKGISGLEGLRIDLVGAVTLTRNELAMRLDTIATETRGVKTAVQQINTFHIQGGNASKIADAVALRLQGVTA